MNTIEKLEIFWRNIPNEFEIKAVSGEEIKIYNRGFIHDEMNIYKQAIIKIGHQTWAGNVAICERSTDFLKLERKYKNGIILLIVLKNDANIFIDGKTTLPTLVIDDDVLCMYYKIGKMRELCIKYYQLMNYAKCVNDVDMYNNAKKNVMQLSELLKIEEKMLNIKK